MRTSWRKSYLNKDRYPAAGFVSRDERGLYTSMFLKPHLITEPPKHEDWDVIGEHRKLAPAKKAIEKYARKNGYVANSKWE